MSNSVMRGLSDENGSWKIICICAAQGRSLLLGSGAISTIALGLWNRTWPDVGLQGAHDAARRRRLAAAALAHQRQRLALLDIEGHVVDGAHVADSTVRRKPF